MGAQGSLWEVHPPPAGGVDRASQGGALAPPDRPYQREALAGGSGYPGIFRCLDEHLAALLVLPTGTGKTRVFAHVAWEYVRRRGRRVLVVAHRTELISQAANRLVLDVGFRPDEVGIEQASSRSGHEPVVVGSVQSLQGARLERFGPDEFGLIITDEAHHAPASSYRALYEHFEGARRLGVTATPDRLDGAGLGKWFGAIAYAYEIRDAIEDGWLVPLRARIVTVDSIDLSSVRRTAGDLNEQDLDAVLTSIPALAGVAKPTLELVGDRPTLIFANSVAHARLLADTLNRLRPGSAVAVDGSADPFSRRAVLDSFSRREFQFLINCALYTEGVDLPLVSAVVMARPTQSRSLYAQMAGRGTRLLGRSYAESQAAGKHDCLILDMVGNAGRHRLVCALDILDSSVDEPVRRRCKAKLEEGEFDVVEALEVAQREEVQQQRLDLVEQLKVRYRVVDALDQFAVLGVRPRPGRWGGARATERQLEVLERAKIKGAEKLDRGEASAVIDAIMRRRREGLCSLPMAMQLIRRGLNPDLPFETARRVMDAIAANGWRTPAEVADDPALQITAEQLEAKRQELRLDQGGA